MNVTSGSGARQASRSRIYSEAVLGLHRQPAVVALAFETGRDKFEAVGLLTALFEIAADGAVELASGQITAGADRLAAAVGGDANFWRAVAGLDFAELLNTTPKDDPE